MALYMSIVEDYIEYLKDHKRLDEAASKLASVVNNDNFASKLLIIVH